MEIHSYRIGPQTGMHNDERGILRRLGEYFSIQFEDYELNEYENTIINRICESTHHGKVIIIELSEWDFDEQPLLTWFIQQFWRRMVDELANSIAKRELLQVYLFAVIMSGSRIPTDILTPHLCPDGAFVSHRIINLPLEYWSLDDIRIWLAGDPSLQREQGCVIDRIAKTIYKASEKGKPVAVANKLLERYWEGKRR
ncbi:MAG: hypothetical protein EI684_15720 [Candidatus Viridilinea halotolerans]|uniref:Inactive STAND domain-containing protein n=1 Tax=Candidatus Viridilinea halotolerans TaxID=2491704 RepID=A0A426TVK7_9CHLR|nr:MAG: hypothetical protein EI684_15720 [Candidatus Viridilinea halotolerans]